jgi:hypothetical protein
MAPTNLIALIGPQQGGKTTLLASIKDCVEEKTFGYPRTLDPQLSAISQAGQEKGRDRAAVLQQLSAVAGEYAAIQQRHIERDSEGVATQLDRTFEYHFSLSWSGSSPISEWERQTATVTIVDAAGELLTNAPRIDGGVEVVIPPETKEKYLSTLLQADSIVLVLPLIPLDDVDWVPTFQSIVDGLCDLAGAEARLRYFTVVFSQYERLFTDFGPRALSCASMPSVMAHVLRDQLRQIQWLNKLSDLGRKTNPVKVRFSAASAWGFVRSHGNPNVDLTSGTPRRYAVEGPGRGSRRSLWQPFLTADPFLYPLVGEPHPYMFSFDDLFGASPAPPQPQPVEKPPPPAPPSPAREILTTLDEAEKTKKKPSKPGLFGIVRDFLTE